MMVEDGTSLGGLPGSLLEIAGEPAQVACLYGVLGEYCHLVRNRLNSLKLGLYLARKSGPAYAEATLAELDQRYHVLERLMERVQSICRPVTLAPIRAPLAMLVEERRAKWERLLEGRGMRLEVVPPGVEVRADFDPGRLGQGLDGLVAWRSSASTPGTSAVLSWSLVGPEVEVCWREPDAFGLAAEEGHDEADAMALPLLARIVAAHGGRLAVSLDDGLVVRLRWPADAVPA